MLWLRNTLFPDGSDDISNAGVLWSAAVFTLEAIGGGLILIAMVVILVTVLAYDSLLN